MMTEKEKIHENFVDKIKKEYPELKIIMAADNSGFWKDWVEHNKGIPNTWLTHLISRQKVEEAIRRLLPNNNRKHILLKKLGMETIKKEQLGKKHET